MASLPKPLLTVEEYIALERRLDVKYEYFRGEMFAMSGASPAHVFIHSNLLRHLGNRLEGTPCRALGSDLRVHIQASGLYTYPDVSIFCGGLALDKHQAATSPKVILEILSPSTRRYDISGKFEHYRQIASLEEYVLVEQDSYSINRYRRQPDGDWALTRFQGEDAILALASVNLTVPLREIYSDVPFDLAERDPEQP